MLAGGTTQEFGGGRLRFHLAYGGELHLYSLSRDRLLFDSALVVPRRGPAPDHTLYYALLEGGVVWRTPEERIDGPALLRIGPQLLEGAHETRGRSLYNYGTPLRLVALWIPNRFIPTAAQAVGDEVTRLAGHDALHRSFCDYHDRTERGDSFSNLRGAARAILDGLVARAWVSPLAIDSFETRWGRLIERTFEGLLRAWSSSTNLPSISDVSTISGISRSQLSRDIKVFAKIIANPAARWRSTMFDLRIRHATTLLSAPNTSVREVATFVGYGSTEAMARAFRDAGIPPPVEVRNRLRQLVASFEAMDRACPLR